MNALRSHLTVAKELGITRQGVATAEARALEKLRFMAVLRQDFPPLPGESFGEWFGQLRECAKMLATRSGRARARQHNP